MRSRITVALSICLALGLLTACGVLGGSGRSNTGGGQFPEKVTEKTLKPSVRSVPNADMTLLWKAARDYVERYFPLDVDDDEKHFAETKMMIRYHHLYKHVSADEE